MLFEFFLPFLNTLLEEKGWQKYVARNFVVLYSKTEATESDATLKYGQQLHYVKNILCMNSSY